MAIFPKGLTYGFSPNMTIFPTFFVQAIQATKISLTIFQNEKTPFQAIKTKSSKSRKIYIFFLKGLTHVFGPKMAIFPIFFQTLLGRKMSFTICKNEKTPFQAVKKKKFKKSKKAIFSKELAHGFGLKMAIFPTFFLQAIQARKMSFMIFQNLKSRFQAIKTRSSKSQKMAIFPKGLTLGFGLKMAIF